MDQRSSFIADYAAKRQAQFERAKQLREQRVTPPLEPSYQRAEGQRSNASIQQSGNGPQVAMDELPARPVTLRSSAPDNSGPSYAPTQYQYQASGGTNWSNSIRPQQYDAPPVASQMVAARSRTIEVSEQHFREATTRGIITPDQARQLWAVLSDQATVVAPASQRQQTQQPAPQYDPRQYAPQQATYKGSYIHQQLSAQAQQQQYDDDESTPQYDYGQPPAPAKLSKSLAARTTPKVGNHRPEWNEDFVSAGLEDEEYAPPPKAAPKKSVAPKSTPRREWKDDFTTPSQDDDSSRDEYYPPPKIAPKKSVKTVVQRREWNDEVANEYGREAPPSPPCAPAAKKVAPKLSQAQQRRQQYEDEQPPLDQVMPQKAQPSKQPPASQQSRTAQSRGLPSKKDQPPPEPEPPQQSPEEIEHFLQQKEEARRQFEEALQEANAREPLIPCDLCGRTFRQSVIDRHANACRVANKKRKAFDSKDARLSGIEGIEDVIVEAPKKKVAARPAKAMPKWKVQHQQFQAALKAFKPGEAGAPPPPPPPDDRVSCPHCSRKFASETAERHIPHCAKTINKPKPVMRPGDRR